MDAVGNNSFSFVGLGDQVEQAPEGNILQVFAFPVFPKDIPGDDIRDGPVMFIGIIVFFLAKFCVKCSFILLELIPFCLHRCLFSHLRGTAARSLSLYCTTVCPLKKT